MIVRFYATLRPIVGGPTATVDLPEMATVRVLLDHLVTRFPPLDEELFSEPGVLFGHVHVFVNGRDAPYLESALDTVLSEEDSVDIFPATAGG